MNYDPFSTGLIGMAGAMLTPGQGLGHGFTAFNQGVNQGLANQSQAEYRRAMTSNIKAQEDERRMKLEQAKRQEEARRQFAALMGVPGDAPAADPMRALVQTWNPHKVQAALNAGYTPEQIKLMAEGGNLGRPEVARTIEQADASGLPQTIQYDKFGNPIGSPIRKPVELRSTNLDGTQINENPYTGQQVGPGKARVPFEYNPDGTMKPGVLAAKQSVARAGKTDVNIIGDSFEKGLGGGVAKNITDNAEAARGAVQSIETARRVVNAINSGGINAGPGATVEQFFDQIATKMGVAGKDQKERMLRTREVIQGLAQLELNAAQQMKGQGQITEAERAILRRAASGDISSMTQQELIRLAQITDKVARARIRAHNATIQPLKSNPNAASVLPALSVDEPEPISFEPQAPASLDDLLRKYGG